MRRTKAFRICLTVSPPILEVNRAFLWNDFILVSGDHCTLLLSKHESREVFSICVLVNRFLRTRRRVAAQYVSLFKISLNMNICQEYISESWGELEIVSKSAKNSWAMALWEQQKEDIWKQESWFKCTYFFSTATISMQNASFSLEALLDYIWFFLGILHCRWKSVFSVLSSCLTPAGMSKDQVPEFVIPDMMTGARKYFECIDAKVGSQKFF